MNMKGEKNRAILKLPENCEMSKIVHLFLFWQTFCSCIPSAGREESRFAVHKCLHLDSMVKSTFNGNQQNGNLVEPGDV